VAEVPTLLTWGPSASHRLTGPVIFNALDATCFHAEGQEILDRCKGYLLGRVQ